MQSDRQFFAGGRFWMRFADAGFHKLLDRIDQGLEFGAIEASLPDGANRILGGRGEGPLAVVELTSWRALMRLAGSGSVGWYKAWQLGEWASPDPVPLFDLFMRNGRALGETARASGFGRLVNRIAHWFHRNSKEGARRNIAAHYDLGNDFYASWLDPSMNYSSALFGKENARDAGGLVSAQRSKMDAIAERLRLKPCDTVLEIGCGWGTLAHHLAHEKNASVTAISLSEEQLAWARETYGEAGPSLRYEFCDYRDVDMHYDAILSVEMVEAVGQTYWPDYLDCVARCLKTGGRFAIQYIAIDDALFEGYSRNADFIQAYIFPGGCLVSERRFRALAEERGLKWTHQEDFGQDYADTLKIWREKFDEAVETGQLPAGFDEDFVRLWRYYLMYCEGGFRGGGIKVAQATLIKT